MPEFFLELFSEEIPARMQADAVETLKNRMLEALAPLSPKIEGVWYGPRRLAVAFKVESATVAVEEEIRGPRVTAPVAAVEGFMRKNAAGRDELVYDGDFYYLRRIRPSVRATDLLRSDNFTAIIATLPWPKSMRWGQSGSFTWVRPLRRVVCLLDGLVVLIEVGPVTASDESEGHRFLSPGIFRVSSWKQWTGELERRCVVADFDQRQQRIVNGLRAAGAARGLSIVADQALRDEVTGLVEWPVCLLGAIEPRFMKLPPEVRELSMKVNQKYFATRDAAGQPAPFFAFVANIEAADGGAAIVAGNERVLRARLADAEHFWNLDRQVPLEDYLPRLKSVVFHAKLGSQFDRAKRISKLAREIAETVGADAASADAAEQAGLLCKADLVTGMVGEFPELQGIMGGYYADDPALGEAIRTHYQPKGPSDAVPHGLVPCAVALADKVDTLRQFFIINEKPSGSRDPYALRRAALGCIRIVLENKLSLSLLDLSEGAPGLFEFLAERVGHKLRSDGERPDILEAAFASSGETDLVTLMQNFEALKMFLGTEDGSDLLVAYRRAANIVRGDQFNDGQFPGHPDPATLGDGAEVELHEAIRKSDREIKNAIDAAKPLDAMRALASLRPYVDSFFETVTVNVEDGDIRRNRRSLLSELVDTMHLVANFSLLEG